MITKLTALALALALPAAAIVSASDPAAAKTGTGRPAAVHYLIALDVPLAPSDVAFRRSLHVRETGSFVRDGRLYLAVTAPTEAALEAFLQGVGRESAEIARLP